MSALNSEHRPGPILGTSYRSPWRVAWDLWRARGSFRGFVEFAVIGGIVIWFLEARGAPELPAVLKDVGEAAGIQIRTEPKQNATLPLGKKAQAPLAPKLSDIELDQRHFETAPEPLRFQLMQAFDAYRARRYQAALDLLNQADPDDRLVLLMRGLALIALRGGDTFQTGIGLLKKAVERGEPKAMGFLGIMTLTGLPGLNRNVAEGRAYLERAAKAGEISALRVLGEGYLSGWIGSIDPARAATYLRAASDRGDLQSIFRLAESYFVGRGMAQDHKEAERLFVLAAEKGHAEAQAMLGTWRLFPYLSGVSADPADALQWLERAAAQGEPHAMENLGLFYVEYGKRSGQQDVPRGVDIFRQCTEQTLHGACAFAYATALHHGQGIPRDPVKAYALYIVSNARGENPKAVTRMNDLKKTLSADEILRANAMVAEFTANYGKKKTPEIPILDCSFRSGRPCAG
jgi:TPR repeat protein